MSLSQASDRAWKTAIDRHCTAFSDEGAIISMRSQARAPLTIVYATCCCIVGKKTTLPPALGSRILYGLWSADYVHIRAA